MPIDVVEQIRRLAGAYDEVVDDVTAAEVIDRAGSTRPIDLTTVRRRRLPRADWSRRAAAAAGIFLVGGLVVALAWMSSGGQAPVGSPPTGATVPTTVSGTSAPAPSSAPVTATPDLDRLADWPAAASSRPTVDQVPMLLPTTPITVAGTPVASSFDGGDMARRIYTQVFADASRGILMTLQTEPGGTDSTPDYLRRSVEIAGWDDAFHGDPDGGLYVGVTDPGGVVRLTAAGLAPDAADALLAGMQRRGEGEPGWDLPASAGALVEINGAWTEDGAQRWLTWFDPASPGGTRTVAQLGLSPSHTDLIVAALGSEFEQVDIGGTVGWYNAVSERRAVVWSPDGSTIAVLGVVDDRVDALELARSLTAVSASVFEQSTTTERPAALGDGCDGSLFC